ncbi:unnamed protein product [Microthlaspi erraticum]|uniref:Uncharacterized protein n=1 Tax=Microthlaspi erraticum TaxID=1685480 RepID=A0A6D2J9S5_9BRAS|nr:unnamed protein product [Microthlaspi erraticum]
MADEAARAHAAEVAQANEEGRDPPPPPPNPQDPAGDINVQPQAGTQTIGYYDSREGTALARPDELSATETVRVERMDRKETGRARPESRTVTVDPGSKRSASAEFLVHTQDLADQIARPRQIHRPSAQTFLGQGKSPFH